MQKLENIMQLYNYKKILFFFFLKIQCSFFKKKFFVCKKLPTLKIFKKKKVCLFFMTKFRAFFRFGIVYNRKLFYYKNIGKTRIPKAYTYRYKRRYRKRNFLKILKLVILKVKIFVKTYNIDLLKIGFKFKKMVYKKRLKKFYKFKVRRNKKLRKTFLRWKFFCWFVSVIKTNAYFKEVLFNNFFIRSHSHRTEKLKKLRRK